MKKMLLLICAALCMTACTSTPTPESLISTMEEQYKCGNTNAALATFDKLSADYCLNDLQKQKLITVRQYFEPEWNYEITECGVVTSEKKKKQAQSSTYSSNSNSYSSYSKPAPEPDQYYYECANCGLIVTSATPPSGGSGDCIDRFRKNATWAFHSFQRLGKVGTKHIYGCSKCGLKLKSDTGFGFYSGTCSDGKSKHQWQQVY